MRKYVINSSDANLMYCYFLPVVAVMWKRIGYEPLSLALGIRDEWAKNPATEYVYDKVNEVSRIITLDRIPGFKDSTIAQCSRMFVSAESFPEDDYLLVFDVDLLPLNPKWWTQQDFSYDFNSFGGDWNENQYCMIGQGATVKQWRIVMAIFENGINHEMKMVLDPAKDGWCYDEEILTEQLHKYSGRMQIIPRWPGGIIEKRLDRYDWKFTGQTDLIDCHSVRPGYEHWDKLEPVFKQYCHEDDYKYIREYTEKLLKLIGG